MHIYEKRFQPPYLDMFRFSMNIWCDLTEKIKSSPELTTIRVFHHLCIFRIRNSAQLCSWNVWSVYRSIRELSSHLYGRQCSVRVAIVSGKSSIDAVNMITSTESTYEVGLSQMARRSHLRQWGLDRCRAYDQLANNRYYYIFQLSNTSAPIGTKWDRKLISWWGRLY